MAGDDASAVTTPRITPDMIKSFNGEGDLMAWITKAKLVAKLAKISDLASFIPLYLEGDALAIFLEMRDSDQNDADKIEAKLREAFTDSPFVAYAKLNRLMWEGEPVDVYATEIRRLVGLAGVRGDGGDTLMKLAFVNGFPESVRVDLQQIDGVSKLKMSDLLSRARILVANQHEGMGAVAQNLSSGRREYGKSQHATMGAVAHPASNSKRSNTIGLSKGGVNEVRNQTQHRQSFRGRCFICYGPHMARNCPKKSEKRSYACFKCVEDGHFANQCTSISEN